MGSAGGTPETWHGTGSPLCRLVEDESRRRVAGYEINPGDIAEHVAIEQSIVQGGYGHRQLFELIQNAADAISESGRLGRVELRLTRGYLYCANEGAALDHPGVTAILHSHVSSKRGHEIGHFGVGFKSVLAVSRRVDVFSRTGSFRFDEHRSRQRIRAAVPTHKGPTPVLRVAEVIDPAEERRGDPELDDLMEWATTVVRLSLDQPRATELDEDFAKFPGEFLLFSPHVHELTLLNRSTGASRAMTVSQLADESLVLQEDGKGRAEWRVFRTVHTVSEGAKRDGGELSGRDEVEIAWAVPLSRRAGAGQYWAFFPTTDESTLSGILNALWKTNSDRQGLLEGRYNHEIIDAAAELVAQSLSYLYDRADPGAHLELLPARPEDAEGWANRRLVTEVYSRTAERRVLPDSEGKLYLPTELKLLPASVGEQARNVWRELKTRPPGWGHERLVSNLLRRSRAARLGAEEPDSDIWLSAIAEPSTPEASIAAITAAEGCAAERDSRGRSRPAGWRTPIVLTRNSELVQPEPSTVFLDDLLVGSSGLETVHPDVQADPNASRVLAEHFGIRPVDPVVELESLLRQCRDALFQQWDVLWATVRKTDVERASQLLGRHRADLRVRALSRDWKKPWEVLLPGSVVPGDGSRDDNVAVDVAYHAADTPMLDLLGVVEGPTLHGLSTAEANEFGDWDSGNWQRTYLNEVRDAFQATARATTGSSPHWSRIIPRSTSGVGPLTQFFRLSEPGRAAFLEQLLPLLDRDPRWTWGHETRFDMYPDIEVDSPALWLVRRHARLATSLGPRPTTDCCGRGLATWSNLLPVVNTDYLCLKLPQTVAELQGPMLDQACERAPECQDISEVASFYGAAALAKHRQPKVLWGTQAGGRVRGSPSEFTVTFQQAVAKLLAADRKVIVVPTQEQALALVEQWGLQPTSSQVDRSVGFNASGPPSPVADLFPGLPPEVLAKHGSVALLPCHELWEETRTAHGGHREDLSSHFQRDERRLLYADSLSGDELLSAFLAALDVEFDEQRRLGVLEYSAEAARSRLAASIESLPTLEGKVAALLSGHSLRQLLPDHVVRAMDASSEPLSGQKLAAMALAIHGSALLSKSRDDLRAAGLIPPWQWAGGEAALRFVRSLGFPDEFAGVPTRDRPPYIEVDGPIVLPPLHHFQETIAQHILDFVGQPEPGRGLVSLPTGAGKTRVVTESLTRAFRVGLMSGCVVWLADRDELCEQAVQSWREVWRAFGPAQSLRVSRLWGRTNDRVEDVRERHHVVVATFQSLVRRVDQTGYDWLGAASMVVVDEAHGSVTPSYTRILDAFGLTPRQTARPLIGLTATPFRGGSIDPGSETERLVRRYGANRFDHGVFQNDDAYPLLRMEKVLSDAQFDVLEGVSDFELTDEELAQFKQFDRLPPALEGRLGLDEDRNRRIVERIASLDAGWPVLVFAASVDHAELLAALLSLRGITARAISSRTDPGARRRAIEQFKSGETRVLTNYGVLTTGFDAPKTRALFVARPIYSPGLYQQVVGRGLRGPANGGTDSCLIVNVADNFAQYGTELAFYQFEQLWRSVKGGFF